MKTGKKDIKTAMFRISITGKDINASKGEALSERGYYVCVLRMILTEETPKEEDGSESPIRFIGTGGDGKLAEEGASSLALAAAKAKDDHPVSHEQDDIDVDKGVHREDDYMPPPDTIDSSDTGSIELMSKLDPLATLQEGLDESEREVTNYK
ncbi:hypothetical protein FRACYDRAFT_254527 [Fragilariopsis cylindrus CCMP1102]|uniref:Uncharacterized protein n=1 Tax=Fragilariopsis cylindrus CCMP1102 TaxID=635003 RepID=A0A1E7EKX3_9STRA|nr:hypothetical protein FRACYDRAFT_254527 [Fragilariopsis cylindrus CCMP1102]|eukprot:OEU06507.1 hypothetical protein FRACYDRAFT_254527 [Fragilariopsis cylindrus CCMP1102]